MKKHAKVAVSIPEKTLAELDRLRRRRRQSRSAAVTQAIQEWLRSQLLTEEERRYAEGYLRHPERTVEVATTARAAASTWDSWE
jgi:metal-responsive CopG/Arc/MetJ family transcriptional regulator